MKNIIFIVLILIFFLNLSYSNSNIYNRKNKLNTFEAGLILSGKYKKEPVYNLGISYNSHISISIYSGYQHNLWRGEYYDLSYSNFIKKFNYMDFYYTLSYWEDLKMKNYSPNMNYKGNSILLGWRLQNSPNVETTLSLKYINYENRDNVKWNKYLLYYTVYIEINNINLSPYISLDRYNIGLGINASYKLILNK